MKGAGECMTKFGTTSAMTFSGVVSISDLREVLSIGDAALEDTMAELEGPGGRF